MEHDFGDSVIEEFVYDGRACVIVQHPSIGHYCGYVQTPLIFSEDDLSYFGGDNYVKLLSVHGGLTYGPDDYGFVGFDCAHAGDVCYDENGLKTTDHAMTTSKEWYLEDVRDEVKHLADQLTALERFYERVGQKLN